MTLASLKVSAPGSIMITGEHAVVYGHPAIVCAVEQRLTVSFKARTDRLVNVQSDICDPITMSIEDATATGPLRYVFGAIALYRDHLSYGFDITIASDINPTLGLGSSAAVTIAMLGGLHFLTAHQQDASLPVSELSKIHRQALGLVRSVQGRGSGADLAASLFGGMVAYQLPQALLSGSDLSPHSCARIDKLPDPPEMSLCYCGYKTPTGEVLKRIAERMVGKEAAFEALYGRMGAISAQTIDAVKKGDWTTFSHSINLYQDLMVELGVSDPALDDLIARARGSDHVSAAKISGSGLGDCIVAFGSPPEHHMAAILAPQGLRIDQSTESE